MKKKYQIIKEKAIGYDYVGYTCGKNGKEEALKCIEDNKNHEKLKPETYYLD